MGGGLMQLVAYGAQDIYLTGNPQITFFKVVYRRHTNFSMESIQQTINGSGKAPASGTTSGTVTISRNGDLVYKVYVRAVSSSTGNLTDGNDLISEVELEIGGQRIDKQTSEWMKVWNELTTPDSKANGLLAMTGGCGQWGDADADPANDGVNYCHIPLQFWFCRNPGLALPLIALQYHEVKLKFTWGAMSYETDCSVWADYIYLDTDERRRFAQVSHEYLIEQLQIQSGSQSSSHKLNFNHPVKELIWTETSVTQTYDSKTKLQLNGHDRFSEQVQEYFLLRQPYDYHTAVPLSNLPSAAATHEHEKIAYIKHLRCNSSSFYQKTFQQPDNTEITSIEFLCVESPTISTGDIGFIVGTSQGGGEIVASAPEVILNEGTTVVTGNITRATIIQTTTSASTAPASANHARGGKRPIYIRLLTSTAVTGSAEGSFTAIIHYRFLPGSNKSTGLRAARTSQFNGHINCYSFALKPEEHQPSGTCNFSRIDNAKLMFSGGTDPTISNIYAVNYNVLRIMSGMGGLAYSN